MNIEMLKTKAADFMRDAETEIAANPRRTLYLIVGLMACGVFLDWVAFFEYFQYVM